MIIFFLLCWSFSFLLNCESHTTKVRVFFALVPARVRPKLFKDSLLVLLLPPFNEFVMIAVLGFERLLS